VDSGLNGVGPDLETKLEGKEGKECKFGRRFLEWSKEGVSCFEECRPC
jgi:hypothetical protein